MNIGFALLIAVSIASVALLPWQEWQRQGLEADLEATKSALREFRDADKKLLQHRLAQTVGRALQEKHEEGAKERQERWGGGCRRLPPTIVEQDFYSDLLHHYLPAIIPGGIESMGKLKKWMDVEYLEQMYGDTQHEVCFAFDDLYAQPLGGTDKLESPARQEMNLKSFLDSLREARRREDRNLSRAFIEQGPIWDRREEDKARKEGEERDWPMMQDVEVPTFALFLRDALMSVNLWLGSHGGEPKKSALHFDSSDNLLVQLIGEKRFVVFSPLESQSVYPKHFERITRAEKGDKREYLPPEEDDKPIDNFSPVLVDAPDVARFPLFRLEEAVTCVVKPGDLLFLPAYTWHNVYSTQNETQGVNSALNFWFKKGAMVDDYHRLYHRILMEANEGA